MQTPVLIVGGGISGLATAFYLGRQGIRSTLLEASGRLGGLIQTERRFQCDLEAGPDSFLATKPAVRELANDLGIADRLMGSNDGRRRVFIVKNGSLIPMPQGMSMMIPTQWRPILQSPLLGAQSKARLLQEYWQRPRTRTSDFSVRDLVLDHFGPEALEYFTEPLLAGVYGGQAADLSAPSVLPRFVEYERRFGSLIKGAQRGATPGSGSESAFQSFTGGMQTLVNKTAAALSSHTDVIFEPVCNLTRSGADGWVATTPNRTLEAKHVVLACPAHAAAPLLAEAEPALCDWLSRIRYSSSLLVTFLFERETFSHPLDGFGFLVPSRERDLIAAATWINTKFPARITPSLVGIRAFLVDPQAEQQMATDDATIVSKVLLDLQRLMKISNTPTDVKVYRWPRSMPQYQVGHGALVEQLSRLLPHNGNLYITSNYLDGVGIPDAIRNAKLVSSRISRINDCS